jgi:2-aminomuconate deaminase
MVTKSVELTRPLARYSHARRVGNLLFIAGQGARDPKTDMEAGITLDALGQVVAIDISIQTSAVLANVERALVDHGLTRRDIVDMQVFLTDMADFSAMNAVWNDFFDEGEPPTRTTVAVKTLPGKNFVEMKAIAAFPDATPGAYT